MRFLTSLSNATLKSQYSAVYASSQQSIHRFTLSYKPKDLSSSTQSATRYWRFICL